MSLCLKATSFEQEKRYDSGPQIEAGQMASLDSSKIPGYPGVFEQTVELLFWGDTTKTGHLRCLKLGEVGTLRLRPRQCPRYGHYIGFYPNCGETSMLERGNFTGDG